MVKSAEDGLVRPVTSTERGNQGSLPSDPDNPDTGDGLEPLTCLVRAMLRDNTFLERSNPRLHSLKLRHLVGLQVDVIVATGARTALSLLKEATTTIPIVMTAAPDPVGEGFVQNLARPGGNLTGMSLQSLELTGKRLELLKELVPSLTAS
jgi:hypothetical protein